MNLSAGIGIKNIKALNMKTVIHLLYFVSLFILLGLFIVLSSCNSKQQPSEPESTLIEITDRQFATEQMKLGEIETMTFENRIKCNGAIVPLPGAIAKVNAPAAGIIKSIRCQNGQWVSSNQSLLEISGNEIIDIQVQFAEAAADYHRAKIDYDRAKLMYEEKISSEKDFMMVDNNYKSSLARYSGLKMKIEAMGLSVSSVENGEFSTSYMIKAPINGYISNMNVQIGSFIDSQSELPEIINPKMVQLKLSLFVADMAQVKVGQTVSYRSVNSPETYPATLTSLGVAIDDETKTIDCYASLSDNRPANIITYTYIESEIVTGSDSVAALPDEAIIKTESSNIILVVERRENDSWYFTPVEVTVGRQFNGYSEIVSGATNKQIVTAGVYNINK